MRKFRIISFLLFLLPFLSCERDGYDLSLHLGPYGEGETRRVLLLYEAGFNDISRYIAPNIDTLKQGWLPGKERNDNVLLVVSHFTQGKYSMETSPALV